MPFGFAGQHGYQSDSVTGLMRLGHRYYDASTGRFLSRDPLRDGDNWYAYCNNDPVNKIDPEGQNAAAIAWGIRWAIAVEVGGGGPENPVADIIVGGILVFEIGIAIYDYVNQANTPRQRLRDTDPPNSWQETQPGDNNKISRRKYGPDGNPEKDIHINHPPGHGPNPHAHDDPTGPGRTHPGRPLRPDEDPHEGK